MSNTALCPHHPPSHTSAFPLSTHSAFQLNYYSLKISLDLSPLLFHTCTLPSPPPHWRILTLLSLILHLCCPHSFSCLLCCSRACFLLCLEGPWQLGGSEAAGGQVCDCGGGKGSLEGWVRSTREDGGEHGGMAGRQVF